MTHSGLTKYALILDGIASTESAPTAITLLGITTIRKKRGNRSSTCILENTAQISMTKILWIKTMAFIVSLLPLGTRKMARGKYKWWMSRQDRLDKLVVGVRSGRGAYRGLAVLILIVSMNEFWE